MKIPLRIDPSSATTQFIPSESDFSFYRDQFYVVSGFVHEYGQVVTINMLGRFKLQTDMIEHNVTFDNNTIELYSTGVIWIALFESNNFHMYNSCGGI